MKIVEQNVELIRIDQDPQVIIEEAGRTCYKSEDLISAGSSVQFTDMLIKRDHTAMIEFADATFRITTDRGISHEIVRHRIASYAQESTRYCNYSKEKFGNELSFIEPPGMDAHNKALWIASCVFAEKMYFAMLKAGSKPEIARSVLPTCIKTEIVMKTNLREWLHFINLRSAPAAHPQIRPIARSIHEFLSFYAPSIFKLNQFGDNNGCG